jgi:hypothetical protein
MPDSSLQGAPETEDHVVGALRHSPAAESMKQVGIL